MEGGWPSSQVGAPDDDSMSEDEPILSSQVGHEAAAAARHARLKDLGSGLNAEETITGNDRLPFEAPAETRGN